MFSFEGEIRKCTKYSKAIFPCFRASRLVTEVGNVEKVKSASNTVDATRNFILRRIENTSRHHLGSYSLGYVRVLCRCELVFILRSLLHLFRVLFFWQFNAGRLPHQSQCSKTRNYSLIVFSIFLRILQFGGAKSINPNSLSTRSHRGKTSYPRTHSYTKYGIYYTIWQSFYQLEQSSTSNQTLFRP